MTAKKSLSLLFSLCCCIMLLQACGKSKLVTSWADSNQDGYHVDKVLVIAVFKDPITQKIYEDSFVSLLERAGAQAFPGSDHRLGANKPSPGAIKAALKATGATSILITHILSNTTDSYSIRPMDDYVSYFTYWDSASGYQSYVYDRNFAPAETIETRDERIAATLFAAHSVKPIWSAISENVNFEDRLRKDDKGLERLFIDDLKEKKLL